MYSIEYSELFTYKNRLFSTVGFTSPYPLSSTFRSLIVKPFLISLFAVFLTFAFATHDAEARRLGGGKSFGMQRKATAKQEATPAPQRQQTTNTPAPAAPRGRGGGGPGAGRAAGRGRAARAA